MKIFIGERYSSPHQRSSLTNEVVCKHFVEFWSFDLLDVNYYKPSNNSGYRFILVVIDVFSQTELYTPLKNKYSKTIEDEFSNFLTTSKQNLLNEKVIEEGNFIKVFFKTSHNSKNFINFFFIWTKVLRKKKNSIDWKATSLKNQYFKHETLHEKVTDHPSIGTPTLPSPVNKNGFHRSI